MRALCPHCRLPESACLCSSAKPLTSVTEILVLQHPHEARHPKNTLRLARLCLPNMQVQLGESAEDFAHVAAQLSRRRAWLCYPDDHSQPLRRGQAGAPDTLVFIDATWRKAFKMLQLNPWLQALPRCHFIDAPAGDYRLRKTARQGGLSTLEAIAHGLNCVEAGDFSALNALQALWVQRMQGFMPEDVRQRYESR